MQGHRFLRDEAASETALVRPALQNDNLWPVAVVLLQKRFWVNEGIYFALVEILLKLISDSADISAYKIHVHAIIRPFKEQFWKFQSLPDHYCKIDCHPRDEAADEDIAHGEAALSPCLKDAEIDQKEAEQV